MENQNFKVFGSNKIKGPEQYNQSRKVNIILSTFLHMISFADVTHKFSQCCGKNVSIKTNGSTAGRNRNFNHGLIFSSDPLKRDELFEVIQ